MTLQRHPDSGKLLRGPTGKLTHDPNCCCIEFPCVCCNSGTNVTKAIVSVTGFADAECSGCDEFNSDYEFPVTSTTCSSSPYECNWHFDQLAFTGEWCGSTISPPLPYYYVTLDSVFYDSGSGLIGADVTLGWLDSDVGPSGRERWQWSRTLATTSPPFDCLAKLNSLDWSGAADTVDWGVDEPCDHTTPRVSVVFS